MLINDILSIVLSYDYHYINDLLEICKYIEFPLDSYINHMLIKCHMSITDDEFKILQNAHTVDLHRCYKITDVALSHLTNVQKISITYCSANITDNGLLFLKNIQEIYLACCHGITDVGLMHLTKCKHINLRFCINITDAGFNKFLIRQNITSHPQFILV